MKQTFLKSFSARVAMMLLTASVTLTSCEELLGEWDRPTPVPTEKLKSTGTISYDETTVNKILTDPAFTNVLTITGDGTVTYESSNKTVATIDANGEVTLGGIVGTTTITATVTDTDNYTYATKTATYTLNVNSPTIGMFLNKDGSITTTMQTSGDNESYAVIAYVGTVANYFDKFIAIAITDANSGNQCKWGDAVAAVGNYADEHKITFGGTTYQKSNALTTVYDQVADNTATPSNSRTEATIKGWRLPSVTDWRYILAGLGELVTPTPTDPVGISVSTVFGNATQRTNINNACGNVTPTLKTTNGYWTSSDYDGSNAWYHLSTGKFGKGPTTGSYQVRAVFAY